MRFDPIHVFKGHATAAMDYLGRALIVAPDAVAGDQHNAVQAPILTARQALSSAQCHIKQLSSVAKMLGSSLSTEISEQLSNIELVLACHDHNGTSVQDSDPQNKLKNAINALDPINATPSKEMPLKELENIACKIVLDKITEIFKSVKTS